MICYSFSSKMIVLIYYLMFAVKPRIERSTFKSVIIKAGRTHKWSVDIIGEPPPEKTWYVD